MPFSKFLASIVIGVSVVGSPTAVLGQANLPVEVRADLLQNRIIAHLESGELTKARDALDEYRKLDVMMPITLILVDAKIATNLEDHERARSALEEYLNRADRTSAGYQEALTLYADAGERAKEQKEQKQEEDLQRLYDVSVARAAITDDLDEAYRLLARDTDGRIAARLRTRTFCRTISKSKQVGAREPVVIDYDYDALGMMTRRHDIRFEYTLSDELNGWVWRKKTIYPSTELLEEFTYSSDNKWMRFHVYTGPRGRSEWLHSFYFEKDNELVVSQRFKLDSSGSRTKQFVSETYHVKTGRLIESSMTNASGVRVRSATYSYDPAGRLTRLTKKAIGDMNAWETFEYSGGRRPIKSTWQSNGTATYGIKSTTFQYDSDGCLVKAVESSTNPDGKQVRTVTDYEVGVFRIVENTLPSDS
ncbi:MAG: hypothetical protein WA936_01525 [Erythrobacter sp.]|uniref:hypothetical protein n=1 Tax=Erythrobacter sp. TaxID=1042 RepID=UPI003C71147A